MNRSNRTDQVSAKSALNSFLSTYVNQDQVTIYIDERNNHTADEYYSSSSSSTTSLVDAVTNYPVNNSNEYFLADRAIENIL